MDTGFFPDPVGLGGRLSSPFQGARGKPPKRGEWRRAKQLDRRVQPFFWKRTTIMLHTWFRQFRKQLAVGTSRSRPARLEPSLARLRVEALEAREVPTVTFHGGAVLQNVEVQGLYYGSDWSTSSYSTQRSQLDGFLQYIVQSGYTSAMLTSAYGTGIGSASSGQTYAATLDKSQFLTDGTIRSTLQACINAGAVQQPDANRLYVVYVEDNVAIDATAVPGVRGTSQNAFLGYHSAFAGTDRWGRAQDIHYAIIAYPGGTVGNASLSWLSSLNDMTEVTSHELAEAITDPNANYRTLGWYDDTLNGEVGDLCNAQTVYLNGYAVQRIVDQNDQPMTPWSVGPERPVEFVLQSNGDLWEYSSSGWTFVSSGVASVSDQGIDNQGRAMVDYITTSGNAYEFHDRSGSVFLWSGAVQARAGQGVSYVLFSSGYLDEYHDPSANSGGRWTYVYNGSIQSIDAGTDRFGVNAVDVVLSGGDAWMHSDTDGWHFLMSNVSQVSGGQEGLVALLDQYGNAMMFSEGSGSLTWLTSGARTVTTGYNASGNWQIGVILTNAVAYYYTPGTNQWSFFTGGVWQMSKENLGVTTVLFGGTDASYFDLSGQHALVSGGCQEVA
jgi:hypothetical protein